MDDMNMVRFLLRLIKRLLVGLFAMSVLSVVAFRFIPIPLTPLMVIRSFQSILDGEKPTWKYEWVSDKHISKHLKRAVVASEDQRFFEHWGFDLHEIKKATKENKRRKKPRGASTISQQTAKNVFLWPASSWFRKGLEVYFTALIELFWSKDRILEVYLNVIETGPGIYGAEAVANAHFNTSASKLTRIQSARIAATLPNPIRFSSKHPSAYILKRQDQILKQMQNIAWPSDR